MTFQRLLLAIGLVFVVALGWRYRNAPIFMGSAGQPAAAAPAIKFDNGTVRQQPDPASAASAVVQSRPTGPGGMRKCKKGSTVVYTDRICPPGTQEMDIGGNVNVVGGGVPAGAKKAPAEEPDLREQRIQNVLEGRGAR